MTNFDVHPEEVDTECRRRIQIVYPDARQHNVDREGTPDEKQAMQMVINSLRTSAWLLKQVRRIPTDFRDDRYWTGEWRPEAQSMGYPQMQQQGYGMPGMPGPYGHMPMLPPWMMYPPPQSQSPVVVVQSPAPAAQAAPIIVNGAAPSAPMVFQGGGDTRVIPALPAPPAQVHVPVAAPAAFPAVAVAQPSAAAGLPSPAAQPPAADSAPPSEPAAGAPLQDARLDEWRREQLMIDTAKAARDGSDVAREWLEKPAARAGQTVDDFISTLLAKRVGEMRAAALSEAEGA